MAIFDVLFGWRKASKCKKLLGTVQGRLRLLRNKRDSIVRQSRDDVSRLVEKGYLEIATQRAEQLLKDECVLELYDLLDRFCKFIVTNLSYIRRHRECPNDVNEAVSSLIFASARCGELPELRRIRELFRERYGERFAQAAVDLLPGNLVNSKIRDHLSLKEISNDSKFRLVDEFARDQLRAHSQPDILAIEYASELHKQIEEMAERQAICLDIVPISPGTIADLKEEDVMATKVATRATSTNLVASEKGPWVAKLLSQLPRRTDCTSPEVDRLALVATPCKISTSVSCSVEKGIDVVLEKASEEREGTATSSSSESSPQFAELNVVYLDDVEELQSRPRHDREGLDQRAFMFRPSVVPKSTKPEKIVADGNLKQSEPSEKENLSPRVSRKTRVLPGKRVRRRLVSREPETMEDLEYAVYFNAWNSNPSKHLKQSPTELHDRSSNPKPKHHNTRPSKVTGARRESHCHCCVHSKTRDHKVFYANPYHAKGFRGKQDVIPDNSSDTDPLTSSDSEEEDGLLLPSYLRAMTMTPKRQMVQQDRDDGGRIPRSNSCPFQHLPNHVHPKLPDYDELAVKFSALKEEYLVTRPRPRIVKYV